MGERKAMWIGELAARTNVSADTIRYYEQIGVLPEPERTRGGFRLYGEDSIGRLGFVEQAQGLGLSLEEIAEIAAMIDDGVEPCDHVRSRLRQRLAEVEGRIDELTRLRRRLRTALEMAEQAPNRAPCRCRIIEAP